MKTDNPNIKAVLREGEDNYISGFGPIIPGSMLDFEYDNEDNFFIVIHGQRFEEASTAFDFVEMP